MDDGRYSYQIQYSSHDSLILYCRPQPHIRVSLTPVSWQTMQNPMRSLCQELPVQTGGLAHQLPVYTDNPNVSRLHNDLGVSRIRSCQYYDSPGPIEMNMFQRSVVLITNMNCSDLTVVWMKVWTQQNFVAGQDAITDHGIAF